MRDLELRLTWQETHWVISVGPLDDPLVDYLWPVSPPLRTAPQLLIGPGYGVTARQSASMKKQLRFVLTRHDYQEALRVIDQESDGVLERLEQLGRGRLFLAVSEYRIRRDATAAAKQPSETFEWIAFKGQACAPGKPAG